MKDKLQVEFRKIKLEQALSAAVFRKGISAFRYGLVTSGISDHLPIAATADITSDTINIFSWNLLSDDHTFNSFMNVTGTRILLDDIEVPLNILEKDSELRKIKLTYFPDITSKIKLSFYGGIGIKFFFSELSQFLYEHKKSTAEREGDIVYEIDFNRDFLQKFVVEQGSVKLKPNATKEELDLIQKERLYILDILLDKSNKNHCEYLLAIRHSLEIIFHLKEGSFDFANRLDRMAQQPLLLDKLKTQDIYAFQECSDPDDLVEFIEHYVNREVAFISHSIKEGSKDNVVIMFNKSKYKVDDKRIIKGDFSGRKPYIIAVLNNLKTGENIIFGSIHHPGGRENLIIQLEEHIKNLQREIGDVPFFVMGDYNHERDFFKSNLLKFPQYPTFTANDYDNYGKSIDGILANRNVEFGKELNLLTDTMPINIEVKEIVDSNITVIAPASFRQKVAIDNKLPLSATLLGSAKHKLANR